MSQKNKLEVINEAPSWYHPGRSGTLTLNKSIKAGFFGELNPKIANFYKIKDRINLFEIFLDDKTRGKFQGVKAATTPTGW